MGPRTQGRTYFLFEVVCHGDKCHDWRIGFAQDFESLAIRGQAQGHMQNHRWQRRRTLAQFSGREMLLCCRTKAISTIKKDKMADEGFAIHDFHFDDPRYRQLVSRDNIAIFWTEQELIRRVVRPASDTRDLIEFYNFHALVQYVITNHMKTAFTHLLRVQGWKPTISAHELIDMLKHSNHGFPLRLCIFLLPFVEKDNRSSWLWKAPHFMVSSWEWWYLLRQNGFHPKECFYTAQSVNTAYRRGLEYWQMQRQTALALFVCVRRIHGSRDIARVIATLVIKQCWVQVYLICGPRWPRR